MTDNLSEKELDNNLVKKPYSLITGQFNLDSRERDIVTLMIKKLNQDSYLVHKNKKKALSLKYKFTNDELRNLFSKDNRESLSRSLRKSIESILFRTALINDGSRWRIIQLLHSPAYDRGELSFQVPDVTADLLLNFSQGYSEIDLRLSLSLRANAEKCILDMVAAYKDSNGDFFIKIKDYADLIGVKLDDYKSYTTFFVNQLNKPIGRLIKASGDMWISKKGFPKGYTISKTGRAYKPTDIITLKLQYVPPREAKTTAEPTEQMLIGEQGLTLDFIAKQIERYAMTAKATGDMGLTEDEVMDFYDEATNKDEYKYLKDHMRKAIRLPS